jgi:hypothetical protein
MLPSQTVKYIEQSVQRRRIHTSPSLARSICETWGECATASEGWGRPPKSMPHCVASMLGLGSRSDAALLIVGPATQTRTSATVLAWHSSLAGFVWHSAYSRRAFDSPAHPSTQLILPARFHSCPSIREAQAAAWVNYLLQAASDSAYWLDRAHLELVGLCINDEGT